MSRPLRIPAQERFSVSEYQRAIAEAIADQTSDAIFVMGSDGIVTYSNPAAEEIFGFSAAECEDHDFHDLLHHHNSDGLPCDRETCPMELVRREGRTVREFEAVLLHKKGTPVPVSISNSPLDLNGYVAGSLLTVRDITIRHKAERAMRESDERIRRLIAADVVGIVIETGERVVEANDYFLRMLGYSREDFRKNGLSLKGRTSADFLKINEEHRQKLIRTGSCEAFETEYTGQDGMPVPVLMGGIAVEYGDEVCMLGFVIDLRERRTRERQILNAHRLETLGQLVGGISHDFNNLLTIMLGRSEEILDALPADDTLRTVAMEICESATHAAELTHQLIAFGRERAQKLQTIRLDQVVLNVEKLLQRLIGDRINIVFVLAKEPLSIRADENQLEQIVMNLALNARDAMPDGGTLWIEASRISADDELAAMCLGAPPGKYVQLMVSDTGSGMTPDVRERCFEPFFTTKQPGKGTGLGLATVATIVKETGGTVTVHSAPGTGTTFRILFPIAAAAGNANEPLETPGRVAGTILVVEDEEKIRSYIVTLLSEAGYKVVEASNGAEGMKVARTYRGHIDLVLTDFAMPGLNGREMARRLDQKREGLRVLMMSGYGEPESLSRNRDLAYIQKPFTRKELLAKIQEVLGPRSPEDEKPAAPVSE